MVQVTADEALISTFGRLVEAHSHLGRQLGRSMGTEAGISLAQFEVLLRISRAENGRVSMSALAQQVALTSGGITKLVDRMIEAGLVMRVPCPTDRRVAFAALTRQGQATLAQARVGHLSNLRQAFAGFTGRDLRTFDELLDRLRAAQLT